MAKRLRYGSGPHSIEMDDIYDKYVRAWADRAVPGIIDELEEETQRVHDEAKGRWPVGKNPLTAKQPIRSRDGLDWEVRYNRDRQELEGRITNSAWWARYVSVWYLGGKNAMVELLRKPLRKAQKRFEDKILDRVIQALSQHEG